MSIQKLSGDRIMAVGEGIAFDQHLLAERALDRMAPAIDLGANRLDDYARRCGFIQA